MVMHITYYTSKGSVYTHTLEGNQDYWIKKDKDGEFHSLVEGLQISKKKLQKLIKEYPANLLDQTYCFDETVEREFLDEAKREQVDVLFEGKDTVIVFIIKRESGQHAMGCSSQVVKIEKVK